MEKLKICKLCTNIIISGHFIAIDNTSQEFTYALSFQLNLNDSDEQLVCTSCFAKLLAACKFKSRCLDVNTRIKSYNINTKTELSEVDLRKVCSEGLSTEQSVRIPDDQKMCYLCLKMINNQYRMMHEVDACWIKTCIPEVNLSFSKDPAICRECLESLGVHSNFVQSCLEEEEKTRNRSRIKIESNDYASPLEVYIKEEVVEIKSDGIDSNCADDFKCQKEIKFDRSSGERSMEYQCTEENVNIREFPCEINLENDIYKSREDQSNNTGLDNTKSDKHMDPLETTMYKCEFCPYQTKYRSNFWTHKLKHKDESEVNMYNCDKCSYKSKRGSYFKRHQLIHMDESQVVIYKCESCSFQTKHRSSLGVHQLKHKDKSEVNMHKCDYCSYKSITKNNLRRHQLVHMDTSDAVIYICDFCSFQTKLENDFKRHELLHTDESVVNVYKCEFCFFQTKYRGSFRVHQLKHKDESEVNMFKCEFCPYKSKTHYNLKRHKLTHVDKSEVVVYKCEFCPHQTKHKDALKRHQHRHKDKSKVFTS